MYLKILEINVLKYMNLILFIFLSATGSAWKACLKMTWVKLELLTNNDTLKMIEKWVRVQICDATYRYAKANNKCMKKYNKNVELSYLMYLVANTLYRSVVFQKFSANGLNGKKNYLSLMKSS